MWGVTRVYLVVLVVVAASAAAEVVLKVILEAAKCQLLMYVHPCIVVVADAT